jgi:hypothetical protein
MKRITSMLAITFISLSMDCWAELPPWLEDPKHHIYKHSQSYCTPIINQAYEARLIAGAKVRGAIAQALDNHVTATSSLVRRTTETEENNIVTEQLTEEIKVKSSHRLAGFTVIKQGVYSKEEQRHFCIWAGIATGLHF